MEAAVVSPFNLPEEYYRRIKIKLRFFNVLNGSFTDQPYRKVKRWEVTPDISLALPTVTSFVAV
jgi:hypothetical protein